MRTIPLKCYYLLSIKHALKNGAYTFHLNVVLTKQKNGATCIKPLTVTKSKQCYQIIHLKLTFPLKMVIAKPFT